MVDPPESASFPFLEIERLFQDSSFHWFILSVFAALFTIWLVIKLRNARLGKKKHLLEKNIGNPHTSKTDSKPPTATAPVASDMVDWTQRLKDGLRKTRTHLSLSLSALFTGSPLDETFLENLHEALYHADVGAQAASTLTEHLKIAAKNTTPSWEEARGFLQEKITEILEPKNSQPALFQQPPQGILMIGVNGAGKTTTIGKLASYFHNTQNKSVLLCAADTFRAAAIEQLMVWGDRLGLPLIKHQAGSDPAAVAFDAISAATSRKTDLLLIDTAGRLHSKSELMAELAKVKKVSQKALAEKSLETWLVIDATTGQNAMQQVKIFHQAIGIDGLVVTKLDGTAKGGALVGICEQFNIPIRFIGIGEKPEDLRPFNAREFADSMF